MTPAAAPAADIGRELAGAVPVNGRDVPGSRQAAGPRGDRPLPARCILRTMARVNTQALARMRNWRMPTDDRLVGLLYARLCGALALLILGAALWLTGWGA